MMFENHDNLVRDKILHGEVILVLGAGANAGSTNRCNEPIINGKQLSCKLAQKARIEYHGEGLSEVSTAVTHILGKETIDKFLIEQFRYCKPSSSLQDIFNYTWKRLYTWNYDDAIVEAGRSSVQRLQMYNGLRDAVEEIDQRANLQCIFLHGMITDLQNGVILTQEDYARSLQSGTHEWYRELASDYRAETVIFVGSSLSEPILEAEIARASRPENQYGGYSFLITPDDLTPIKKSSLESRKVIHIQAKLDDFMNWIKKEIGPKISPKDLIKENTYFTEDNIALFSNSDVEVAHSLKPIIAKDVALALSETGSPKVMRTGRLFLKGFPVTWQIAASEIPVRLQQTDALEKSIKDAANNHRPIFVTIGQAGSGKSTATMQAILSLQQEGEYDIFELDASVKSVSKAISVLKRISDRPKIVFLRNLFVFGSQISDNFGEARNAKITFVSTARSAEWHEHFKRHFEGQCQTYIFQRFQPIDYAPLISRLEKYVPAPAFVKLKEHQKIEKFKKSRNQLLIALREATESRNFDDIIIDEYNSLANSDVQELFILVGLCTLARVGVSASHAAEAYQNSARGIPFAEAIDRLKGIVEPGPGGRLLARHEFYVRNILDSQASIDLILKCIKDMLSPFTKYQIPITKHVNRTDAALFRFLLNHSVIRERAEHAGAKERGVEIYENFEIPFQLDGHFWLQYGLYYQRLGENLAAMEMLEKSIQAFPDNPFALHALAAERLRQAAARKHYDHETQFLIEEAVKDLEKLEKTDHLFFDQYPLVTLSRDHVDALVVHGKNNQAIKFAKEYYERLNILEKKQSTEQITQEKKRLLTFIVTGEWNRSGY